MSFLNRRRDTRQAHGGLALVLHGGADAVTPPAGSRALHERAASLEKTLRLYDAARHDLLHEPEAGEVTQAIVGFVTGRLR